VLLFYQEIFGHEDLSIYHHEVMPDFAMDCVTLSIGQQLLNHGGSV
jgi:hypothetical protein